MEQRIRLSEKFSYASFRFGQSIITMFVSTYILYYYTDVLLLPAASVSLLLLIVRLFDGGIDPVIGYYMDKRQPRRGKFKGYLYVWIIPLCLSTILLFAPFSVEKNVAVLVCFVVYMLWSFFYSMVESASAALSISMCSEEGQRRELNTFRIVASALSTLAVTYSALLFVKYFGKADEQKGYFHTAIFFTVIAFVMMFPCIMPINERNYKPGNRLNLRGNLSVLTKNKKLLFFLLMYCCNQIASGLKTQTSLYYFKYTLGRMDMVPIFFLVGRLASLAPQPLIVILSKKFKIIFLIIAGYILASAAILCIFFTGSSPWSMIILSGVSSLFSAFPANLAFTYSAEIADEISQGNDNSFSGIVSSLMGFSHRVGTSIAGSVAALILALSAYIPNTVQTQTTLFGIQLCFIGITAFMYFFSGVCALFSYKSKKYR